MVFLDFSDYQITDAGEKNNEFSVEYSSTSVLFSLQISMEEMGVVVAENQKFEFRAKSIKKKHFSESLDCHDSAAWVKTKDSLNVLPLQADDFSGGHWLKKSTAFLRNMSFIIRTSE